MFLTLLQKLGAKQTSVLVEKTVKALKTEEPCDEDQITSDYYDLFEDEEVWLKLLDYVGQELYGRYYLRAQAIEEAGESFFDPKQWEGELPDA